MIATITTTIQQQQKQQKQQQQQQQQQQKQPKQKLSDDLFFFLLLLLFFSFFAFYLSYEWLVGTIFSQSVFPQNNEHKNGHFFKTPFPAEKIVISGLFKHYLLQQMHLLGFQNLQLVNN